MIEVFNVLSDWNFDWRFSDLSANNFEDMFVVLFNDWDLESTHVQNIGR